MSALLGDLKQKWWVYLFLTFCWVFGVATCIYWAVVINLQMYQWRTSWIIVTAPLLLIAPANALLLAFPKDATPGMMPLIRSVRTIALTLSGILLFVTSPLVVLAIGALGYMLVEMFGQYHISLREAVQEVPMILFYISVAIGPFISALWGASRLRVSRAAAGARGKGGLRIATVLSVIASFVLIAMFPPVFTKACSEVVANRTMVPHGLLLLRAIGDKDTLLRACYGDSDSFSNFYVDWRNALDRKPVAREIYYRVTGVPFNSVQHPHDNSGDDGYYDWIDWYDSDFAGETVGGIVRGLSLNKSSITGWVDPDEEMAHLNWSMHFKDTAGFRDELRAQILLPPHAVISDCELTVNGVKHKAVIGTRESTRKAYTTAAEKGERPLMVSTAGAGRVLLQSSTGYWGKDADLSFDIITPLKAIADDRVALPLPMFTERNFKVVGNHEIHLTSTEGMVAGPSSVSSLKSEISGSISNQLLGTSRSLIFCRKARASAVSAPDPSNRASAIVQTVQASKESDDRPLVVLIDGSSTMQSSMQAICDALATVRSKDATIVWAADEPVVVVQHVPGGRAEWNGAIRRLRDAACLGGQNNGHALDVAFENVKPDSHAAVVWLHGPQPVRFTEVAVASTLTNPKNTDSLYEYQVVTGPNEVVKSLDKCSKLIQVPRIDNIYDDMKMLFAQLSGVQDKYSVQRNLIPVLATTVPLAKHQAELQQLYGAEVVYANTDNKKERIKYGKLAEQLNIVTPLTSALVLDTDKYTEYGVVKHSDSQTLAAGKPELALQSLNAFSAASGVIPAKPEPPMTMIMAFALPLLALFAWLLRRRKAMT